MPVIQIIMLHCFVQQIAISDHERNSRVNPLLKVAGKGLKSAKETASKTVRFIICRVKHI